MSLAGRSEITLNCGEMMQQLNVLPRAAMPGEMVPRDYFRRLAREEICKQGRALELDLGCGDGSFLIEMGKHFPERDFLGVERLLGRVTKVSKKIRRNELANVKILRLESRYVVEWLLPEDSISRLHLLCPDPWPKSKHHRRRILQVDFLEAAWKSLTVCGEFLFMTDHEEYFAWALEKIEVFGKFEQREWHADSFFYPKTDFQVQWEGEGKTMWRVRCVKVAL